MEVTTINVKAAEAILNGSIVDGYITSTTGRLVLVTNGGDEIDAGLIFPPTTLVGARIENGDLIFERHNGESVIGGVNILKKKSIVDQISASGTFTKYAGCKLLQVICVGGGGGGSGGTKLSASTPTAASTPAGVGGGGGGMSTFWLPANIVPDSVPVTIGARGERGAISTSTTAQPGGAGGDTRFGDSSLGNLIAGGGGGGGVVSATTPGTPGRGLYPGGVGSRVGVDGREFAAANGAGGGGGTHGYGGQSYTGAREGSQSSSVATGANQGFTGGGGNPNWLYGAGAGGSGGGNSSGTGAGGTGGTAGFPGGGGGAGGCCGSSGPNGGIGGLGAQGVIWVISYF